MTRRISDPATAVRRARSVEWRRRRFARAGRRWIAVSLLALALPGAACEQPRPPGSEADAVADTPPDTAESLPLSDPLRRHTARAGEEALTRWGACPFECCVYREWQALSEIPVRSAAADTARVVATIPEGAWFHADTGFVRVTSPQLVVVREPVEAYRVEPDDPVGGTPATLQPGDTLLVLDYLGEGYFNLLRDGELFSAPQFWPGDGGWPSGDDLKGRVTGEYAAEWWVRVRTSEGEEGWIDSYGAAVGNADACA